VSSERFFQDLRGVFQGALGGFAESFTAALRRNTTLQLGEIRALDLAELQADFPGQVILASMVYGREDAPRLGSASGEADFVMPAGLAAIWGDLIRRGGSGEGNSEGALSASEFSAAVHLDAINELLGQMAAGLDRHLSATSKLAIQLTPGPCGLVSLGEQAERLESYFRVDLFVKLEQMSQALLTLLISAEMAQDLQKVAQSARRLAADIPPRVAEDGMGGCTGPEVRGAAFQDFGLGGNAPDGAGHNIDMLMDLELPVIIELGRSSMFIRDILDLGPGSVVELNKLSGEPVDLYVNDKKFALGEVVVIDENFGIRITDLVKVEDRIRSLK
jgi:flagellar motor switch protein FliN/FliY